MAPSRRTSSRLAPPASPRQEEAQTDRPETPTPVMSSDSVTSPPHSACRSLKSEKNAPDSPFTGFASNLQSLDSVERPRGLLSSFQPPSSPFTTLASSLPNLMNSSPGNFSTPGANFSGNWMSSETAALGSHSSMLSPLSSWPLSGKVRRTLIGDDSAELASVTSEIQSPKTPHMHIMCFGENEVTKTYTPTTVGAFGQFLSMSGNRKPIVLSGPGKSSKRPQSRRKLEGNLLCSETMPGREDKLSDLQSSSTENDTGLCMLSAFSAQAHVEEEEEEEEEEDNRRLSTGSMMSGKSTPPTAEGKSAGKQGSKQREASQPPRDPSKLCKCKKSKCVRQYCVCFRAGLLCEGCECNDCLNDGKHEEERKAAIDHIKTSDPLAFVEKVRPDGEVEEVAATKGEDKNSKHHVRGCRCKNSRCLKRYCECFEHGVTCSAKCECRECLNGRPPSDGEPQFKKRKVGSVAAVPVRAELSAPIRVTGASTRGLERKTTVETRATVGKDNIKVLPQAPATPHRADFQLSPVTPMQPVQASANLNFSPKWTDNTSLSPGFSLGGQVPSSSHSDISPMKSEGLHESSDSPTPGFILDSNENEGEAMEEEKEESETSEETALSKGCSQALDEKAEMTICQDFGLVA